MRRVLLVVGIGVLAGVALGLLEVFVVVPLALNMLIAWVIVF